MCGNVEKWIFPLIVPLWLRMMPFAQHVIQERKKYLSKMTEIPENPIIPIIPIIPNKIKKNHFYLPKNLHI